jgi:tRNA(adenine34) deaminase
MGGMTAVPDEYYMDIALEQARQAESAGEVPDGAVVVGNGEDLGIGFNHPISSNDPTRHAEIVAIRKASDSVKNYRLTGSTLYCTLEPCPMCAGAMIHARIDRLVYGVTDPRAGAAGSLYNILQDPRLNHRVTVSSGIRGIECGLLLKAFFERKRSSRRDIG